MKNVAGVYRFDRFVLDTADRRLSDERGSVELSGRYLDALVLLVAEEGRLVTKKRLLEEVWKGVPVTDEALTQCVRSLRRALGDEAGRPRFIETVPRHGYRFMAPVARGFTEGERDAARGAPRLQADRGEALARFVGMGRAGLIGGGAAGLIGGLAYGFAGIADGGAGGSLSGLLVLAGVTAVVGMIGGSSVGFGVGAASFFQRREPWYLLGGAGGGLLVGAVVRLAGLDAFALLFGSAPRAMTGAGEGLLLGAAIGTGVWIARERGRRIALLAGAILTSLAGAGTALLGGRLMGGSLAALAAQFPAARLSLDRLSLFGEATFGPVSHGAAMVFALTVEQQRRPGVFHHRH
ncbi:MAG: transcriptional regulator [Hyphomicrobiales bacterium]|nr:MAG: transcriptional regulator [Hyphomicrobiales bacterium]